MDASAIAEPSRVSSDAAPEASSQRLDALLRDPRGFGREATLDAAATAVDGRLRASDDAADRSLDARRDQKTAKRRRLVDQSGLRLAPAASSRAGQPREPIEGSTTEQARREPTLLEGETRRSRAKSTARRWTLAKAANRSVALEAGATSQAASELSRARGARSGGFVRA